MTANTAFTFANLGIGESLLVCIRGAYTPSFPDPTLAWQPSAPSYVDNGHGMLFQFLRFQAGEVQGVYITP